MAYKNTTRHDGDDSFYHVYNRGIAKMDIFLEEEDFSYFEKLLARSLSRKPVQDKYGRLYSNYFDAIQIHAYCLMPNHYHLLILQKNKGEIEKFMRSLNVAYSMYFNKKYKRVGPIFESRYKAVLITEDEQLRHVSRYIHLNPVGYRLWDHSSYSDHVYEARDWVTTDFILGMFASKQKYLDFVDDYEDVKRQNDRYKRVIGNS
ncbi:MAG: transposase [Candidatus Nomurabacteria bacterium]|jgi:putative transposase|nr:transposase [Candidatus Nomurabacteria bacterium]